MLPRYIRTLSMRSKLCTALLAITVCSYTVIAPFTKVEESFNLQATHDILFHGAKIDQYDHIEFPGVVPRTFLGMILFFFLSSPRYKLTHSNTNTGPLVLSSIIYPLKTLNYTHNILTSHYSNSKFAYQQAGRLLLGLISVAALVRLQATLHKRFGTTLASIFILLTALQFHLPFYMSRPLPNTFALILSCIGTSHWINKKPKRALAWLTFAALVVRCDVILLAGLIGIHLLSSRQISLFEGIHVGIVTAILGLGLTVPIDSFFWQRWVWPEGEVLWFNTALNKSSEWGISPPMWYFKSALPRALHAAYPLAFLGALLDSRVRPLMFVAFSFVALYSNLGHKELRFLFPVLPLWNVCAAAAVSKLWNAKQGRLLWRLVLFSMFSAGMVTVLLAAAASRLNYPGGMAMQKLHEIAKDRVTHAVQSSQHIKVHIDVFPAMTGVSRFCEQGLPWIYSKQEGLTLNQMKEAGFDFLLSDKPSVPGYEVVEVVDGFSGIASPRSIVREWVESKKLLVLKTAPAVYIHKFITS